MRTFRYILAIGLISSYASISAQDDFIKAKIYADFINESVYVHDTTFNKKSELIIVSEIKNYDLGANLDIESLYDYLTGNTESNELFQLMKDKFGESPISYFYQIPWGNFGKLLAQDSTFGFLILELDTLLKEKYRLKYIDSIETKYKLKYTKGKTPGDSDSWDKFYSKNENCFGIIKLSDILISKNEKIAIFYTESYHYSLFSSGDLVFMELADNGWRILQYINIWRS
nr:hypothetical protein [Allomuricauda sp.]